MLMAVKAFERSLRVGRSKKLKAREKIEVESILIRIL